MKVKFAKEKSEYSNLLVKIMTKALNPAITYKAILRMEELENIVKEQGDELIFIVTTRDTNPMKDKTAPPMSMDKICPNSDDGLHGIGGGVRGSEVRCGACGQLDEIETKKAQDWWNGTHESGCLCSKCESEES